MLEVSIRMIPMGDRDGRHDIVRFLIINDASGTPESGNYRVQVYGNGERKARARLAVEGFDRSRGALALATLVIARWQATGRDLYCEALNERLADLCSPATTSQRAGTRTRTD